MTTGYRHQLEVYYNRVCSNRGVWARANKSWADFKKWADRQFVFGGLLRLFVFCGVTKFHQ